METDRGRGNKRGGGKGRGGRWPYRGKGDRGNKQNNLQRDGNMHMGNVTGTNPFIHPDQHMGGAGNMYMGNHPDMGGTGWSNPDPRYEGLPPRPPSELGGAFGRDFRTEQQIPNQNFPYSSGDGGRGNRAQQHPYSPHPQYSPQFATRPPPPHIPPHFNHGPRGPMNHSDNQGHNMIPPQWHPEGPPNQNREFQRPYAPNNQGAHFRKGDGFNRNSNMHQNPRFPSNNPIIPGQQHVRGPPGVNPGLWMGQESRNSESNLHRGSSMESLSSERSFKLNVQDHNAKRGYGIRKNNHRRTRNKPQNDLSSKPLDMDFSMSGDNRPASRSSSYSNEPSNSMEDFDLPTASGVNLQQQPYRGKGRARDRGQGSFRGSDTNACHRPLSRNNYNSDDLSNNFENLNLPYASSTGFEHPNGNKNVRGRGKGHGYEGPDTHQNEGGDIRPLSRSSSCSNDTNVAGHENQPENYQNLSKGRKKNKGNDNSKQTKQKIKNQDQGKRDNLRKKQFPNKPDQLKSNITAEQLERLKQQDPMEILQKLGDGNEYSSLLQEDHDLKVFLLVVDILLRICETPSSQPRAEILRQASLPAFTNQLFTCVTEYPYLEDDDMLQYVNQFFENTISLYETLSDLMPSASRMWHNHILEVQKSLKIMSKNPKINLNPNLLMMANFLLDEVGQNLKKDVKEEKVQERDKKKETYNPEPVGDFRTVSLYPRPEDVYAEQPFLHPNIVEGPYSSVDNYLDIHFKLLREDFMSPIRKAMKDYKRQCNSKDKFKRIDNVRIYRKVKFLHPKTVFDTVGYEVCFDVDNKLQRVNWEFSNRFMFGSLLLFTNDHFDSFFMATVANRNVKDLEKKLVTVELVENVESMKSILGKEFIMAESEAYFNPYYQVLKALQRFNETNFPLARYIVHANTETEPPSYLHLAVEYTIKMAGNTFTFPVLSNMYWPTNEQLGLDFSQYGAFKAALTNDLSVIQGPPGTGKTFLGLRIAQALLLNAHIWNQTNTPIFVVCFTNHALDQFLEGLLPVTTKLVRIGGKSKGGELDKFNIRERRKEYSYYKKVQGREIRDLKLKMSTVFADIQVHQENLKALENRIGVLSVKTLQLVMLEEQRNYFSGDDDLMDWLLEGVSGAKNNDRVKITITADRGIVREAPTVDPLVADEEDMRVKAAFFDTIDLDRTVGPSEDTISVQFACDVDIVAKKQEGLKQQLNGKGKNKLHKFQLLQITKTSESLDLLLTHLRKELVESKKFPRSLVEKENLLRESYLRKLKPDDRWRLYHTWVNILREGLVVELGNKDALYKEYSFKYEQLRQNDDLQILKTSHVVGTTTTLAAKFQPMFEALAPRIVIVEEAAEVLEAHIIASLSRSCEHLILIGDHKQLRPSVAETRMARQYQLDVSLFERLVRNQMACYTLTLQHRMRPEISRQLVPTIYPVLRDDQSVLNRDDIKGMDKNVFFMTHNNFEDEVTEITSKRNRFEAEILLGLAKYLVQQGYKPQEITILATYKGQMYHMKNEIKNISGFPKGIQITVVDNFQGEENRIILLSLVRSNAVNKIGFLEIENRICVALSRARDGLYILGNMNCLTASSNIWPKIRNSLANHQLFGPALNLRCQIHREQVTKIESAKDFSKVSEGGCSLLCGQPLRCGHSCKSMCHVEQDYHQRYKCKEPCPKILCAEGHQCPKKCHQPCGMCQIPMRRQLTCGHYANVPCHMDVREYACIEPVQVVVPICRHTITVACHSRLTPECNLPCTKRLECGHSCEQMCHEAEDPDHLDYGCLKPCARTNKNCSKDHKCPLACFEECNPCPELSIRELKCGHSLKILCSADLSSVVCQQKCRKLLDCGHPCSKKCFQICEPCEQPVSKTVMGCGHKMEIPCGMAATRRLCQGQCPNTLGCGHQCSKRCRDICSEQDCEYPVKVKEKTSLFSRFTSKPKILPMLCGHWEAHVPCNKYNQVEAMKPHELMQYCSEPCGKELNCKHICGGTCSECMQGRIHKLCNEQCGNVLICGHSCKVPCREVCPACKEPCRHECKHSKCSRKCGEECVPCKEPCDYACDHLRCTKRCGDLCNREPCYESCPKRLSCGHSCVGFCGEPCPPCRQCEPEHFEEIFFTGEETEEDAKWVKLVDCGHTVESTGVEMWLNMEQESGEIGCKVCPRCKTPIVKVQRFMNLIKQTYMDIQKVKRQCFGKRDEIQKERAQALRKMQNVMFQQMTTTTEPVDELEKIYSELMRELPEVKSKKRNTIDEHRLRVLCFWTEFFICVYTRKQEVWSRLDEESKSLLTEKINFLTRLLTKRRQKISRQEMQGFECELKRINRMADLFVYTSSPEYRMASSVPYPKNTRLALETAIFSIITYDEELDKIVKDLLNKLKEQIRSSTAISDAEKAMINKAMSSSFRSAQKTGHWFKCKNGHVYCITECGGAMEEKQCPIRGCGERIGGQHHRLRDDQALAAEMDGARHAAWSDANNMANYG